LLAAPNAIPPSISSKSHPHSAIAILVINYLHLKTNVMTNAKMVLILMSTVQLTVMMETPSIKMAAAKVVQSRPTLVASTLQTLASHFAAV
jgi:hypothetical protein